MATSNPIDTQSERKHLCPSSTRSRGTCWLNRLRSQAQSSGARDTMCWLAEPNSCATPEIPGPWVVGKKVPPKQNHGDVTTRTRSGCGIAQPTEAHYNQNTWWVMNKIHFPPCLHLIPECSILVTISWCGITRTSSQQECPLWCQPSPQEHFLQPQRPMDSLPSEGHMPCSSALHLQCHFSVASMHFTHIQSTPKGRRYHQGRGFLRTNYKRSR